MIFGLGLMVASAAPPKVGNPAPNFTVTTLTSAKTSLAAITKIRAAVFFFIGTTCGMTQHLFPNYKKAYAALKAAKVPVYFVLDADAKGAKDWAKAMKVNVPVLLDPKIQSFKTYGFRSSPASIVVAKGGKLVSIAPGCSQSALASAVTMGSRAMGAAVPKVEFKSAPKTLTYG